MNVASLAPVLILSATFGEGHRRAARAIEKALRDVEPTLQIEERDYFTFVNLTLNHVVREAYIQSVRHVPGMYGAFYHLTDKVTPKSVVQRSINRMGQAPLGEFLAAQKAPLVISTYSTPAGILSDLKERGIWQGTNVVAVTDYTVHAQWIHPNVDLYFVGAPEVKEGLVRRGIAPERVEVSGIPVDPIFGTKVDRAWARRKLGLGDGPVVMFMGGAYGMISDFGRVVHMLGNLPQGAEVLVAAGRDHRRQEESAQAAVGTRNKVHIVPFTEHVEELFAASDVLVTKAGGLTVSEALCQGVPMVIYRPIPGQEIRNVDYLCKHEAALTASNIDELEQRVQWLLDHPKQRAALGQKALSLAHPEAASRVAERVIALLRSRSSAQ